MAKKKNQKVTLKASHGEYPLNYEIHHLEMNGTFNGCILYINAGTPSDPPVIPPGGNTGG